MGSDRRKTELVRVERSNWGRQRGAAGLGEDAELVRTEQNIPRVQNCWGVLDA